LHLVGVLFPHINDDARSKSHQINTVLSELVDPLQRDASHLISVVSELIRAKRLLICYL